MLSKNRTNLWNNFRSTGSKNNRFGEVLVGHSLVFHLVVFFQSRSFEKLFWSWLGHKRRSVKPERTKNIFCLAVALFSPDQKFWAEFNATFEDPLDVSMTLHFCNFRSRRLQGHLPYFPCIRDPFCPFRFENRVSHLHRSKFFVIV